MKPVSVIALFVFALLPMSAIAGVDQEMVRCSAVAGDAERLACYDRLAASLSAEAAASIEARRTAAAEAAKQAAIEAEKRRVDEFGGEQAGVTRGGGDKLDALSGKVVEAFLDPYGKYLLLLDNGQMWKQLDGKLLTVRAGDAISLERASLGSYMLRVDRQRRSVRARRFR